MFMWLSNENVRDLLGTSATITTVLQFLTGCLICQNYIRKKSTGEVSGISESKQIFFSSTDWFLITDFVTSVYKRIVVLLAMASLWSSRTWKYSDPRQCDGSDSVFLVLHFLLHLHYQQETNVSSASSGFLYDNLLDCLQQVWAKRLASLEINR